MDIYELIDNLIGAHISGNCGEPNLITMHPNAVKLIADDVQFKSNISMPTDGDYGKLKYRGIRVVRSYDLKDDEILVSRVNTN